LAHGRAAEAFTDELLVKPLREALAEV